MVTLIEAFQCDLCGWLVKLFYVFVHLVLNICFTVCVFPQLLIVLSCNCLKKKQTTVYELNLHGAMGI